MKLLFDQNISFRIVKLLSKSFEDCEHLSECNLLNSEDSQIWTYAKEHKYSIVTFDSDFYDISLIKGHPPKIIWIRTVNSSTKEIVKLLSNNKTQLLNFLENPELNDISCLELH